jgi:hypothetical protein
MKGPSNVAETANNRLVAWNTTYNEYLKLTHQLAQCQPHERDALERAAAEQQDDVLQTEAPSLRAVFAKLEILFEGQMDSLDPESEAKRLVLEDLHDITVDLRELIGAAESEVKLAN